ncbi:MAG: hypothetical protein ACTTKL_08375 [Treponema sp.]
MAIKKFAAVLCMAAAFLPLSAAEKKDAGTVPPDKREEKSAADETDNAVLSEKAEAEDDGTSAEETWQYLEWEEKRSEFVSRYEIVIEAYAEKEDAYTEAARYFTNGNARRLQIKPLLPPGTYRYKVVTYNLVDVPEVESEWFNFKIFQAFMPEINDIYATVNLTSTVFLEEINDGIFAVNGKNLFTLSEGENDISYTDYYLVSERKIGKAEIRPVILEHDGKNRKLKVRFSMKDLDVGVYHLIAVDASGLKTPFSKRNEITVQFKKRVDVNLSLGYSLPIILFDDTIPNYMGSRVWPLSGTFRATVLPSKHKFGYFGTGVSGTYVRMDKQDDGYKIGGNMLFTHALFVYQFPLRLTSKKSGKTRHTLTLEAHTGAGMTVFTDFKFDFGGVYSEPLNSGSFSILAGGAVQAFITPRLFAEFNLDYIHAFPKDIKFGALVPSIGIGWQF